MANSLNLRPQEKRIIMVILVVVFVVLNLVLVFPHFKDYAKIQKDLAATRLNIANYSAFIAKDLDAVGGMKRQVQILEKQQDSAVPFKEIQLMQTITAQARASGIFIQSSSDVRPQRIGPENQSDKFFESQSTRIVVQATEDALVKFLYDVGNDPAMIRVRDLNMNPLDNNRYKLNASLTLTADYQKTSTNKPGLVKSAPPSAKTAAQTAPPAPQGPGARRTPTNANPSAAAAGSRTRPAPTNANPASARKGSAPPPSLPMPGGDASPPRRGPRPTPIPPPAPGQSGPRGLPTRPVRTNAD